MGKKTLFAILAVAAVTALVFLGLRLFGRSDGPIDQLQTAAVRRGELVATADTVGTVQTAGAVNLVFQAPGQVSAVSVQEGQVVAASQEIARLDPTDVELQVAQAEAGLAIARAGLQQASKGAAPEEVAAARAALTSAQENLKRLQAGPTETDVEIARLRWEQAKDQLWSAQAQRDAIAGNPMASGASVEQARGAVAAAEMAAEIARLQYEQVQQGIGESELRAAEAQVAQAQANLARLTGGPAAESVAVAEAQVQQAEVALAMAQRSLNQMVLKAPFAGTITRLDLQVGQMVGPSAPVGVLAGAAGLEIVADMSEIDVARLSVGQEATITLDALPDRPLKGHVATVAPAGVSVQGIVNFPVTIRFDEEEPVLKPGMTASVTIVTGRRENVLLVPNRAIRTRSGDYVVYLLRDGRPTEVSVQIGLSGEGSTEILGDTLQEGDLLVLNAGTIFQQSMTIGVGHAEGVR